MKQRYNDPMFRILVISLFVANLLLLGFRSDKPAVQPEPKKDRTVVKSNNIPTIHLFGEMVQDQDLLSGNRQCFSLGPFHTIEDKDETRLLLLEVSTRISERQTQAMVEKGYWVFMPPYDSLLEANQVLFSLQALGLEDTGVVYDGDLKNAISLGYFMRQENALRHKKGLEDRGFVPMIRVQRQPEPRYWLDYEQTPGSGLVTLGMQNRPNDFMQRPLPCPEEDLFEVVNADSQDPVREQAQQQIPEEENDPDPDPDGNAGPAERIESIPQEAVETVPDSTGDVGGAEIVDTAKGNENEPVEGAGAVLDQAVEAVPDTPGEVGSGEEADDVANGIENTPQDAVETLTDAAVEVVPESTGEVRSGEIVDAAEGNESEPAESAGAVLDQAAETVPDTPAEMGSGEEADDVANGIENTPQDTVETLTGAAVETDLESTGEVGAGEESDAVESIQNVPLESAEALLNKTVGTGPLWYGEPEAVEETDASEGTENVPVEDTEDLLNPGIETESETGSTDGTGEG